MRRPPPKQKGLADMSSIMETLPDCGRSAWHLGIVWLLSRYQENEVEGVKLVDLLAANYLIFKDLCSLSTEVDFGVSSCTWARFLMNTSLRSQSRQPWASSGSSWQTSPPPSRGGMRERSCLTTTCPLIKSQTALLFEPSVKFQFDCNRFYILGCIWDTSQWISKLRTKLSFYNYEYNQFTRLIFQSTSPNHQSNKTL